MNKCEFEIIHLRFYMKLQITEHLYYFTSSSEPLGTFQTLGYRIPLRYKYLHFNDNKSVASGKVKWTCLRFRNLPKLQEVKLKFWLLFFPTNTPQPSRVTKTFSQNETWLLDYKMDWLYSHCVWLPWGIDTTSKTSPQIWVFLQITLSCPPPSHHQLSHGLLHNLPTNLVASNLATILA